jgi:hypothetical protein
MNAICDRIAHNENIWSLFVLQQGFSYRAVRRTSSWKK